VADSFRDLLATHKSTEYVGLVPSHPSCHAIRFIKAGAGLALIDLGLVECWQSGSRAAALHGRHGTTDVVPSRETPPAAITDAEEVRIRAGLQGAGTDYMLGSVSEVLEFCGKQ
jgi:hypothetical protein